jgi:hypothetical protein
LPLLPATKVTWPNDVHFREGVGVRVRVLEANVRERVLVPDVVLETTVRVRERVLVPDVVRVLVPVVLRVGVRDCDDCASALKGKKAASSASSTARRGIFSFCARGGGQGENAEQTDGPGRE